MELFLFMLDSMQTRDRKLFATVVLFMDNCNEVD